MIWGIIGAMEQEIALVKAHMTVTETKTIYGSEYISGKLYDNDVVLVCCSVGTINAASCANIIIREYHADAVINVGIAGAAGEGLQVMDVVISDEVAFHDADTVITKFYPFTNRFAADSRLIRLAEKCCAQMEDRGFNYRVGSIATGDLFVNDAEVKADIVRRLAPDCIEMEGAAIGQVAYMNEVPFLVIRTMSDSADDSADDTYDNFLEVAANHSAQIIINMLKNAADF